MGDGIAAARVQFRGASRRARRGALLGDQAARDRNSTVIGRASLRADRDPEEQPDRFHHRVLRHDHRLRADLAYLVDGRPRTRRRLRGVRVVRVARCRRIFNSCRRGRPARPHAAAGARAMARATRPRRGAGMSTTDAFAGRDPYRIGHGRDWVSTGAGRGYVYATGHGEGGPASKRVIVGYGFWIFLLSDIVMFSAFFAAHAVLQTATAGGPSGRELFNWWSIAIQTACLLASSFTCGLSAVATEARSQIWTQVGLLVTGLLGLAFLVLEGRDFAGMVMQGAGPQRSAFLSSLFAVVGLHGLHVRAVLLCIGTRLT